MLCRLSLPRQQPPEMRKGFAAQKIRQSPHGHQGKPNGHIDGEDNVHFLGYRRHTAHINDHGEIGAVLKIWGGEVGVLCGEI